MRLCDVQQYKELIELALKELVNAAEELTTETSPTTPLPRFREFIFIEKNEEKVSWPGRDWEGYYLPEYFYTPIDKACSNINITCISILRLSGGQSRLILKALRRIQAATEWCKARTEGRKRAAEEIRKQQQKFADELDAEIVFSALKK